jgi:hypothetical protein
MFALAPVVYEESVPGRQFTIVEEEAYDSDAEYYADY